MRKLCGTILAAAMLAAGLGCGRRGDEASFATFDARARAGESLTVAYFGCSLMWSANASEPNETGFRGLMSRYLEQRYPKAHFRFVDASVVGTGAMLGVFRLGADSGTVPLLPSPRPVSPCGEVAWAVRGSQNLRAGRSKPPCGENAWAVRGERYPREPTSAEQQLATSNPIIPPPLAGYDIRDDIWMFYI